MSDYIPEFNEPISPLRAIANWVKKYREAAGLRAACEVKGHCRHELATGSAATNYRGYCPNAITLDQMFGPKSKMAKAPSKPSVAP